MSGRFKRCKVCGTSKASDFAPRKSVICKNCDVSNNTEVSNLQDLPLNASYKSSVEETSQVNPSIIIEEKVSNNSLKLENLTDSEKNKDSFTPPNTPEDESLKEFSSINPEENVNTNSQEQNHIYVQKEEFESILNLISELQNTVALLQKDVILLNRLKNMFPILFPKDEKN